MANTKETLFVPIGTGVVWKFSGTKTIYTAALQTLLGISNTQPANTKVLSGNRSSFGIPQVRVRYEKTGTGETAVLATGNFICASSKLEEALAGLAAQTYKGKNITEAYLARKRIFV